MKGTLEMRAILVRDPNKVISAAVLSSPKLTEHEVEGISLMANVPDEVLRTIGANRRWMKNYSIVLGLTRNPKTPVDRNIPEALRIAARKKVVSGPRS
jgi:hypothetical protein